MDNKIRYSRVPKYAYGTKGIPKFGVGTPEEGTESMGTTQEGGFGSKIGGSMGWFAFANQAQTGARGMTAKKRVVNPKTGEVTEYQTTGEGQITEEIAQPYHEKYMNDIKNHEYGGIAAQLAGGPIGQMAYNGIWGKKKKDAFNQGKEQEAKSAQDAIDAENAKNALAFENKQRDMYSRAYLAENPANGQAGASIYAYGTKEDSYGTTSINPNSKNMSPQQWHEYNTGLGYKEVPTSSTITGRHKEYYNPNEYALDKDNNFIKKADIGKIVNYNNDKTYQPIIKYQPMSDIVTPSKPIITPTSDRTATTFGTFNGKATTAYKYKDGRTATLYNDGTPVQYAYGTSNGMALPKKALGGELNPLASDIEKAEGASHEQGGITLHDNNGQAKAEIEGEEVVVDDNKVLSNRLPFTGGKSFAEVGEELGKEKGKNEEKLKTGDMFAKNGAKRTIDGINKKMDILLKYQDVVRNKLGLSTPPVNNIPTAKWGTDADGNPVWEDDMADYKEPDINMQSKGVVFPGRETNLKGDMSLKEIPQYSKPASTKRKFDARGYGQMAENAAPYLDNVINAGLIKNTPNIPNPNKREAIDEMAMPLSTTYNINPALAANNQDLKEYNKNVLDNTSNSNNARAEIASGFAKKLRANNELYGQKENAENQLKNQNALNLQGVNNRNVNNHQMINNENKAIGDKYNWDNMLRKSDIQDRTSLLAAETTNDLTTSIQDKRMAELDNKKIFYDSLKHDDAAGFASLVGTPQMKELMNNPETRKAVYDSLKRGGQTAAHKKAKELYGE